LLVVDPVKRLTLEQIKLHPFFSQCREMGNFMTTLSCTAFPKSLLENQNRHRSNEKAVEDKLYVGMSDRILGTK
jgi:hypothetical protein